MRGTGPNWAICADFDPYDAEGNLIPQPETEERELEPAEEAPCEES